MKSLIKKYWIPLVVILLLGVMGYAFIGGDKNSSLTDTDDTTITDSVVMIETVPLTDLDHEVMVSKSSQLTSSSTITISAQAAGRVNTIWVEPGSTVTQGRQLISLTDTTNSYAIALDRASVALEGVELQYEQSEVQLDKSIDDATTAYEQALQTYNTLLVQYDQQLNQAKLNLNSTVTTTDATLTTLQSQLFSLKSSLQSFTITLKDHIDRVVGDSVQYSSTADTYEPSLIARGRTQYQQAQGDFDELVDYLELLGDIDTSVTGDELVSVVNEMKTIVQTENTMLLNLQDMYQLALPSAGFTSALQAQLQTEVTTMLSQNQSQLSQLVSYQDQVAKLITTNTDGQTNADITKEQAQLSYDATKTSLDDSLAKAKLALDQAESARDFAIENKDIQLRLLANSISSAQVSYRDASANAAKLSITAPLNGQVADILVDKGQEVSIGTALVSFIGTAENEVRITVNAAQRDALSVGDDVHVAYGALAYSGTITSIGGVADTTLSYPVTIAVPENMTVIGGTVTVSIPFQTANPLVPLSAVRPRGRDRAMVSFRDGTEVIVQEVQTGETWGGMIEVILDEIPSTYELILTDLTNYDPNIQTIEVRGNEGL